MTFSYVGGMPHRRVVPGIGCPIPNRFFKLERIAGSPG
jgi:hypothetical protein